MVKLPAMTAQLSHEYWQKLAEETRREIDRITNIRNLLNPQDLADAAVECDRKALLAKWVELRNTFIDLGERYRALARKASQQKHPSLTKPRAEKIATRRLALTVSPSLQPRLPLLSSDNPKAIMLDLVQPLLTTGRSFRAGAKAGRDKTRRQRTERDDIRR